MAKHTKRSDRNPLPLGVSEMAEPNVSPLVAETETPSANVVEVATDENCVPDLTAYVEQFETADAVEAIAAINVPDVANSDKATGGVSGVSDIADAIGAERAGAVRTASARNENVLKVTVCNNAADVLGHTSQALTTTLGGAGVSAAKFALKMVEFAQANAQSNFEFACECAFARSLPDVLNVQTAYAQRQFQLLTAQIEDLRAITADIAATGSAPFNKRAATG
jgi:hypothetical protein